MPDFTARLASGVTTVIWDDHQGSGVSRINPAPTRPSKFLRATVGVPVQFVATFGGVSAPTDIALAFAGAGLFSSDLAEHPALGALAPSGVAGSSSVQMLTPPAAGHYLWVMRHAGGGYVAIHFDAE